MLVCVLPRLCVQCVCFLCLRGPPSPGQRVQAVGRAQVNNLHSRLHYPLNRASLETTGELIHTQPETGNLSKEPASMTTWMCPCRTHQHDCELKQRGKEAVACSRAEPRGTLQLLEHEANSCSAPHTNVLPLSLDFKTPV